MKDIDIDDFLIEVKRSTIGFKKGVIKESTYFNL